MFERVKSGIPGLDELIEGGFLKGDIILLAGGTGAGKTVFSTQFIYNGAVQYGEKGVYATFEEDKETLTRNMLRFGFDLKKLEDEGSIKILDLESLKGKGVSANMDYILSEVNRIGAKRLVIDSITAFLVACKEEFEYRALMHLFYKILKRSGCTAIMTCSIPLGSNKLGIGIEEFVADSVLILENVIVGADLKTRFLIRKMRGTRHSRKYHNVIITDKGLEIIPISIGTE
ncbi:AAA family ATPase [Candidatus Bathyarchaeota archaeon]|nr:AAA family ATPase [Candidatus Bathyarchaeota archaeon]